MEIQALGVPVHSTRSGVLANFRHSATVINLRSHTDIYFIVFFLLFNLFSQEALLPGHMKPQLLVLGGLVLPVAIIVRPERHVTVLPMVGAPLAP
jgi:hypothetical protein